MQVRTFIRLLAAIAAFAALSLSQANAQTRTFQCGKGKAITIAVTGPNSVSAGPIEGRNMRLTKSKQNPFEFRSGDYAVIISQDQTKVDVEIADFGTVKCAFQGGGLIASQPGVGSTDPCGPGFQLAPGTQRCVRRPGNIPQPQKRADDPCPANFMQAPETDRCDPAPGAPAPRKVVAPAGGGKLPMAGRSLGGIMRAGPSQSTAKVMSTGEGNELTILSRGPMWDNYNWFQVNYQGRTGFIWGGIMCSQNPLGGIYQQCEP
jgi:hypothetical protein